MKGSLYTNLISTEHKKSSIGVLIQHSLEIRFISAHLLECQNQQRISWFILLSIHISPMPLGHTRHQKNTPRAWIYKRGARLDGARARRRRRSRRRNRLFSHGYQGVRQKTASEIVWSEAQRFSSSGTESSTLELSIYPSSCPRSAAEIMRIHCASGTSLELVGRSSRQDDGILIINCFQITFFFH